MAGNWNYNQQEQYDVKQNWVGDNDDVPLGQPTWQGQKGNQGEVNDNWDENNWSGPQMPQYEIQDWGVPQGAQDVGSYVPDGLKTDYAAPVLMDFQVGVIEPEKARAALLKKVEEDCCWSDGPAKEMTMEIKSANAYDVRVTSFCERREVKEAWEPKKDQMAVDGPWNGTPPGPWQMWSDGGRPENFTQRVEKKTVPHTSTVQPCWTCSAQGQIMCGRCQGWGQTKCTRCGGDGKKAQTVTNDDGTTTTRQVPCTTCGADGQIRCRKCRGHGCVTCPTCKGWCQMHVFMQLTISWINHDEAIQIEDSKMPDHLIASAKGTVVHEAMGYRLPPVTHFAEQRINDGSTQCLTQANYQGELHIAQKMQVKLVAVATVNSTAGDDKFEWYVYGTDDRVFIDTYPSTCCGCCVVS